MQPIEEIVWIKYVRNYRDCPETRQAFAVKGSIREVRAKCEEDSEETGCMRYIALNEGEQYTVWRDED